MEKKRYIITIEEIVSQAFSVEAETLEEAKSIAAKKYKSAEFVLDNPSLESAHFFAESEDMNEYTDEWEEIV